MAVNNFVISEADIFKYMVVRDDLDLKDTKRNTRLMLRRVSMNIFTNQYYILYKAFEMADKYNIALSYDHLHQILLNNIDELVKAKEHIHLFEEDDLTDVDYANKLIDYVLSEYDMLVDTEIEDVDGLMANVEFYIDTWKNEQHKVIVRNQMDIINEGKKVGRTFYKGSDGANAYYTKAYQTIRSIVDGDVNKLSDNIDTSKDSVEDINAKMKDEASTEVITRMGVKEIDDHYQFARGEIITIQAGTGVGKTRMTGNLVYNAIPNKYNTLYISLEQKSTRIFPMIESRHVLEKFGDYPDIDDKTIRSETFNFENAPLIQEARADLIENPNLGKIRIEGLNLSAKDVYDYMVQVWEEGFHFDIIVLDYFGLLSTGKMNSSRYEALTDVVNMLKSECKSFKGRGFLGILPNQLTKEDEKLLASGDDELTKNAGSESQYLARASDYIFTLYQDPTMKIMNRMMLYVSKVRSGDIKQYKIPMRTDLGKLLFLSEDVEE